MTSPWRIAPSSLRKGLCWDHNPLITPCKDTFRPPRGTKRCESTLNITRFGHQTLFFRSLLDVSYTSFGSSGGRVQRGWDPLWQGFGGFPNTVRAGGWEEGPFMSRVTIN